MKVKFMAIQCKVGGLRAKRELVGLNIGNNAVSRTISVALHIEIAMDA